MTTLPCPDCLPPAKFTFKNFQAVDGTARALKATRDFAEGKGPRWLVIIGCHGSGKTHLARATARRLTERMVRVRYTYSIVLFDHLRDAYRFKHDDPGYVYQVEAEYTRPEVLIVDDLGAESETEWVRERTEKILNLRYEREARTMLTTNLPLEDFPGAIASRMSDRRLSRVVLLKAPDYRKR